MIFQNFLKNFLKLELNILNKIFKLVVVYIKFFINNKTEMLKNILIAI